MLVKNAAGCVEMSISVLRYYGGYADKIHGKTIPIGKLYSVKTVKTCHVPLLSSLLAVWRWQLV